MELVQNAIELLLLHAPLAAEATSRETCEHVLHDLDQHLDQANIHHIVRSYEHTLTPLFVCIRGSHYKSSLQTPRSLRLEELALAILAKLVVRCGSDSLQDRPRALWEIFGRSSSVLGTSDGALNLTTSDESKQSALACCRIVLECKHSPLWSDHDARPKVGHFIAVLLSIISLGRCRVTKTRALDALRVLVHKASNMETLLQFYPGMCSGLCKLLLGDTLREGRHVVSGTLATLETLIVRVLDEGGLLEDGKKNNSGGGGLQLTSMERLRSAVLQSGRVSSRKEGLVEGSSEGSSGGSSGGSSEGSPEVSPGVSSGVSSEDASSSSQRMSEATLRTSLLLSKVTNALTKSKHDHWQIKRSLVRLAASVYRAAIMTSDSSSLLPVCLEIVVGHLYDNNDEVASLSHRVAHEMSSSLPLSFWSLAQQRFRECVLSLSRVARSQSGERALRSRLEVAAGYGVVLGERLRPLFDASGSSIRLLRAIAQCLVLDPVEITTTTALAVERILAAAENEEQGEETKGEVLQGKGEGEGEAKRTVIGEVPSVVVVVSYYEIPFLHVRDACTLKAMETLLQTIAKRCDVHSLLSVLTHPTANDWRKMHSVQCAWMANALLRGAYGGDKVGRMGRMGSVGSVGSVGSDSEGDDGTTMSMDHLPTPSASFQQLKMLCRRTLETESWCYPTSAEILMEEEKKKRRRRRRARRRAKSQGDSQRSDSVEDEHGVAAEEGESAIAARRSLTTMNTNAMVVSLLLRRIGDISMYTTLIGSNFRRLLLSVSYPLLEKLSDSHPVVSQAAHSTLVRVSSSCGYVSVPMMLSDNMDYLVDAVCSRLQRKGERGAAKVVRSIVGQDDPGVGGSGGSDGGSGGGSSSLSSAILNEVIETLLRSMDDEYVNEGGHSMGSDALEWMDICREVAVSLLRVGGGDDVGGTNAMEWKEEAESTLEWLEKREVREVREVREARKGERGEKAATSDKERRDDGMEKEFLSFAAGLSEKRKEESNLLGTYGRDEEEEDDENEDENEDKDMKEDKERENKERDEKESGEGNEENEPTLPSLTPAEKSVDSMLRRCVHYLSSSSIPVRISTLNTINVGLRVLRSNERALLPLVATVWPSVRVAVRASIRPGVGSDVPTCCCALGCVATMAVLCGDFVRARVANELWPLLRSILVRETSRARSMVKEEDLPFIATKAKTTKAKTKATRSEMRLLRSVLSTVCVLGACGMLRPENVLDASMCCFRLLSMDRRVHDTMRMLSMRVLQRMELCCPEMVWFAGTRVFGCRLVRKDTCSNRRFRDVVVSSETKTTKMWESSKTWWSEFLITGRTPF